jgi:phosphatidylglycerophosphatase A
MTQAGLPSLHPPLAVAVRRPNLRFVFAHPAHAIALGLGSGLAPRAPGTAATLWAWLAFLVLDRWLSAAQWGVVLTVGLVVGTWACTVTARHLNSADPGAIVWDEIIAFWAVLWLIMPTDFAGQLAAFVLFRVFDAAKPGPVAWADALYKPRRGPGAALAIGWRQGFGILLDDLVAALCTLLVIAFWRAWW